MNSDSILVDTGPIVALLRADDAEHEACILEAQTLSYPFLTSWAVLTEAAWLLRNWHEGVTKLLLEIESGLIQPVEIDAKAAGWLRNFMIKYRDLKPQLADATLCYLAESRGLNRIFTLDRRDFSVFRNHEDQPFELLPVIR